MLFTRSDFLASLASLTGSADVEERAVGVNFLFEENVSDERRDNFQNNSAHSDLREAANGYFRTFIQGVRRGHIPCTFNAALNGPALLPATLEPTQKIVRLERIDQLMSRDPALDYSIV